MTIWTDLLAAIEAEAIDLGYTGTLTEVGIDQPYLAKLITLLDLRAKLVSGGGGGGVADTTASGTITTQNLVPAGAATTGSAVSIDLDSKGTVTIQVTGTYTGALSAQITTDGTNWITPTHTVFKNMVTGANSVTIPSASVGIWQIEVVGHAKFRLSALAAVTGTATIALRAAANTSQISVAGVSTAANQTTGNSSLTSLVAATIPAFTNSPINLGSANQAVLKASAGAVYKIYCYNKNAATRFFQIHNKATAPVNADVPVESFPIAANSALLIDIAFFGASGRACSTGVSWAFSTTEATLTLGTAADQTSSVGYL